MRTGRPPKYPALSEWATDDLEALWQLQRQLIDAGHGAQFAANLTRLLHWMAATGATDTELSRRSAVEYRRALSELGWQPPNGLAPARRRRRKRQAGRSNPATLAAVGGAATAGIAGAALSGHVAALTTLPPIILVM